MIAEDYTLRFEPPPAAPGGFWSFQVMHRYSEVIASGHGPDLATTKARAYVACAQHFEDLALLLQSERVAT